MKAFTILSLVSVALASIIEKRECAGNNCNRAVTGTRLGDASVSAHKADCSSFMLTTVTPAAVTTTITIDDYSAATAPSKRDEVLEYRQATVKPSSLPSYATACSSAAAYASACSCWGITASVTTAPTPTVTYTTSIDYCDDDL